jgi:hypothetical protein
VSEQHAGQARHDAHAEQARHDAHADQAHYDAQEPVPGLPARLPAGEHVLWQGAPSWRSLARHGFHIRKIALYFAVVLAWDAISAAYDGVLGAMLEPMAQLAGLAGLTLSIVALFCYGVERTTIYTITNRRVVIRAGIALTKTINIPFVRLNAAGLRMFADGCGNILLTPLPADRLAYLVLWPHVQAWNFRHSQPMLRCVRDGARVAAILGEAFAQSSGVQSGAVNMADSKPADRSAVFGAGVQAA